MGTSETKIQENVRKSYWAFLTELYDLERYYWYYKKLDYRIDFIMRCILTLTSLSNIAAWIIWNQFPVLHSVCIGCSQVISALRPSLPFAGRVVAIKHMHPEIKSLFDRVEFFWQTIEFKDVSDLDIINKEYEFKKELREIEDKFTGNEIFPEKKYCLNKAENDRVAYVRAKYLIEDEVTV